MCIRDSSKTGIDLPEEIAGIVYDQKGMNEVELATCTFGQGFTCTMIQQIASFCAVVNGGYYYQPDVYKRQVQVGGSLCVYRDAVGSTVCKGLNIALRLFHHQMNVKEQVCDLPDG